MTLGGQGARDVALRIQWMGRQAAQKRQRAAAEAAAEEKRQPGRARGHSIFAVPVPQRAPPSGHPPIAGGMSVPAAVVAQQMPHPPLYQQTSGMGVQGGFMGRSEGVAAAGPEHVLGIGLRGPGAVASAGLPTMMLDDHGSGTVGGIGGPIGELLETNQGILLQFKDNMRLYKVRAHDCVSIAQFPPTHPPKSCFKIFWTVAHVLAWQSKYQALRSCR